MENSYVFAFLFLFYFSPGGAHDTYCLSGERLHTPRVGHDVCIPCLRGTFIAEEYHSFRECKPCTGIENPDVEVLVSACDSTHDAVILCTSGFYRRRARNVRQTDKCEMCTECPFPARPCEGYYNTVCCPPNQDAVMTPEGVFVCKERPIVCGAGQFFWTSSEECLPCPAGTFMSDHSHTYKDCLKCEELSENNLTQAVITTPCSRTAPTLFGCKAGYFRDPTQESLQIEVPCTPCRICDRRLVDCGMFHDAVCDDEDRMVSTAPTNNTVSTGTTSDGLDMIKQLNATFHGSVHSCLLDCMTEGFATIQDSITQSESSKRNCVLSCFPEFHNAVIVIVWLFASFGIVSLVLLSWVIWRKQKQYVAANNYRNRFLNVRLFTCVLFVLNILGVILFIIDALLITGVIEDKGHGGVAITVCCCVIISLNLVLIVLNNCRQKNFHRRYVDTVEKTFNRAETIKMNDVTQKNLHRRNVDKVKERFEPRNIKKVRFISTSAKRKWIIELKHLQSDESSSCGTPG